MTQPASASRVDAKIRVMRDGPLRQALQSLLDNSGPSVHELRDLRIGDEHGVMMAGLLASNESVAVLNLSSNRLYCKVARAFARALEKNKSLTSLDLSGNFLGGYAEYEAYVSDLSGISALCAALKRNRGLIVLNLEDNRLHVRGAQLVADALAANHTLCMLNVSNTGIGTQVRPSTSRHRPLLSSRP